MKLNLKMLKNDLKRNPAGNIALFLFIALASGLVCAAVITLTQLFTSISGLYETARPPHFLQLHKGEMVQEEIDSFNREFDGIKTWQTVEMISVYGDNLAVYKKNKDSYTKSTDLSECRLDIGLVKQNKELDLLLDSRRNIVNLKKGEIGIPVILMDSYDIDIGDLIVLKTENTERQFRAAEFILDAQMNSTLCSSTRFLLSDEDFDELLNKAGETEYIIEAYFEDTALSLDYQSKYESSNLFQNGQAVTYDMLFLLSALTDIIMALILLLVSILLVLIAFLCIKYTLLAAIEEELSEIGSMKAIGMSYSDIRELYLSKYRLMILGGVVTGFILSLILSKLFMVHIGTTFGEQPAVLTAFLLPIGAGLFVYLITVLYCKGILKRIKKITVVDALVTGKGFESKQRVINGLYKSRLMPVNALLAFREAVFNFRSLLVIFLVMLIASAIIIIPVNSLNTFKSKEFTAYMGSPDADILIEIDQGEELENRFEAMRQFLDNEPEVSEYEEFRRVRVQTLNSDKEYMNLHIDCGIGAGEDLKYLSGGEPHSEKEIALSKLYIDALDKNLGESITIEYQDSRREFVISGIYQDVTGGGLTAKALFDFSNQESEKYTFTVNVSDKKQVKDIADNWSKSFSSGYTIQPMEGFIGQTFGGVIRQIETAAKAVTVVGILIAALIVILFMKLTIAKDASQIAGMKAVGFSDYEVRMQYLYKVSLVTIAGILLGTVISNAAGEALAGMAFDMMGLGISQIRFVIDPLTAFVLIPMLLMLTEIIMTWISTSHIKRINIVSLINE